MGRRKRSSVDRVALGWAAANAGDLAVAERLYRAAIRDGDAYAYNNLAQLLVEDGRLGEGEALFHAGVAAGDGLAAKNLVLFLLEEGKEVAARKAIKKARKMGRPPTDEEIAASRQYFSE
jgi:Flp pilus assembly protein TadD